MKMVYIASPYTIGDTDANVRRQLKASNELMNHGICPVCPLLSHFQHLSFPRPYEDWMEIDIEKLRRCDALLRLPGQSEGADQEVKFAIENGIPLFFDQESLLKKIGGIDEKI